MKVPATFLLFIEWKFENELIKSRQFEHLCIGDGHACYGTITVDVYRAANCNTNVDVSECCVCVENLKFHSPDGSEKKKKKRGKHHKICLFWTIIKCTNSFSFVNIYCSNYMNLKKKKWTVALKGQVLYE